jgi:glutamate racemase
MKIGVFDSGAGGISVANAIKKAMPELEVIYKDDRVNLPYGTKTIDQIYDGCKPVLESLVTDGCELIVVACNTVTTNLIERLRKELKVPLIGMEPMVKPAALMTKSKVIAICATPRTLQSERYAWLKSEYAKDIKVIEPDCSSWTSMIENNNLDKEMVAKIIDNACNAGADVIVLGCTHYHWIEDILTDMAKGRALVIQPEQAIVARLKVVISEMETA